jgi:glycerol kinase
MNSGDEPFASRSGLLTTLGYKLGDAKPTYALEGSVAIAGALVQWLRDNLGIIGSASEIEALAASAPDNGDVYFVPAFSGLYAPYWRAGARGIVAGLTRYADKRHIARAALEATAYQSRDVLDVMARESGVAMRELRVDGGMVVNELLMQFQSDILGAPVVRPKIIETTALGAAYAAGLAVGFWRSTAEIEENWAADRRWTPKMGAGQRERLYDSWGKAVRRSFDWAE